MTGNWQSRNGLKLSNIEGDSFEGFSDKSFFIRVEMHIGTRARLLSYYVIKIDRDQYGDPLKSHVSDMWWFPLLYVFLLRETII